MKPSLAEFGLKDLPETDTAENKPLPLPDFIDVASFVAAPLSEPDALIAGLCHKGGKFALGGNSKSFKTWTFLDLAVSVSHGLPWLNFTTTQSRVLFVNFELQDWTIQRRLNAVADAKGIKLQKDKLSLLNLRGHAANHSEILPQIAKRMKEDFGLVILDPIYKLYGLLDENKAGDIARLLNAIETLTEATRAAAAFGSHFSKGNQSQKESIDRISGSGVFARDPDSILTFTRHETEDCFTVEPTLRAFRPIPPFVVRWKFPLMVRDDALDPSKLKQSAAGRKPAHDPRKLLAVIANTSPENPVTVSAWAADGNIHRSTLVGYLTEMRRQGWIATTGEGGNARQHITPEGKKFLNGK